MERKTSVTVRLDGHELAWLDVLAARDKVTRSEMVRVLLAEAVGVRRSEAVVEHSRLSQELDVSYTDSEGDAVRAMKAETPEFFEPEARPAVEAADRERATCVPRTGQGCGCARFVRDQIKIGRCKVCGHYFGEHEH